MAHRLWEIGRRIVDLSPVALGRTIRFINRSHPIILNQRYVTIIDYTQPSSNRRMYVIDLYRGAVERHQVTHGSGSGDIDFAQYFSDTPGSLATSVGAFLTAASTDESERVGFRLVLHGMESTNENALARGIVMHGSWYASEGYFAMNRRVGRSEGCPAIDPLTARRLLPRLAGGSLLYHYGGTPALDRRYRTVSF